MKALLARLTPYQDLRGWLRGLTVAMCAATFLTLAGAFGTGEAPLPRRSAYWVTLMAVGYLWGAFVARHFFGARPHRRANPVRDGLLAATIMAAPFTVVVWAGSVLILRADMAATAMPLLFLSVWMTAVVITAVNYLVESRRAPPPEPPPPPKFLERLPLKLRGGEIFAVEAEDHYLRLHTSKGQDLILMRLADALAELEGLEGLQVHRSWWVARDAIVDARRSDGRATLTLKDGARVPVSRTYAGELRARGWI